MDSFRIQIQPKNNFRFRYERELERTHGCIKGEDPVDLSEDSSVTKLYPKIKLTVPANDKREFFVLCSLHAYDEDKINRHERLCLSPHLLMRKGVHQLNYAFIFEQMKTVSKDWTARYWELENYIIVRLKVNQYRNSLEQKQSQYQMLGLPLPFEELNDGLDFGNNESGRLNVCLGFTIFERIGEGNYRLHENTIYSNNIYDNCDLKIHRLCNISGSTEGGDNITLLMRLKNGCSYEVHMFDNCGWEEWVKPHSTFGNSSITFTLPPYTGTMNDLYSIDVDIEVVADRRSGFKSKEVKFKYVNNISDNEEIVLRKKPRLQDGVNKESDISTSTKQQVEESQNSKFLYILNDIMNENASDSAVTQPARSEYHNEEHQFSGVSNNLPYENLYNSVPENVGFSQSEQVIGYNLPSSSSNAIHNPHQNYHHQIRENSIPENVGFSQSEQVIGYNLPSTSSNATHNPHQNYHHQILESSVPYNVGFSQSEQVIGYNLASSSSNATHNPHQNYQLQILGNSVPESIGIPQSEQYQLPSATLNHPNNPQIINTNYENYSDRLSLSRVPEQLPSLSPSEILGDLLGTFQPEVSNNDDVSRDKKRRVRRHANTDNSDISRSTRPCASYLNDSNIKPTPIADQNQTEFVKTEQEVIKKLLELCLKDSKENILNPLNFISIKFGNTIVHDALTNNSTLLALDKVLKGRNKYQLNLLHYACLHNKAASIKTLVGMGIALHEQDINGRTPLHLAIDYQHYDCIGKIQELLKDHSSNGRDVETSLKQMLATYNYQGRTVLHLAVLKNLPELLEVMFDFCQRHDIDVTQYEVMGSGDSLAHLAVKTKSWTMMELLKKYIPNYMTLENYAGNTIADTMDDISDRMKAQLKFPAVGNTIVHDALTNNSTLLALDKVLKGRNKYQLNLLHYACLHNKAASIKTLVGMGIALHEQDINGRTPLHLAIDYQHYDCIGKIQELLKDHSSNGRDVETSLKQMLATYNYQGRTVLHLAVLKNLPELLEVMFDFCQRHDIDVTQYEVMGSGDSLAHLAVKTKSWTMMELLKKYIPNYMTLENYAGNTIADTMDDISDRMKAQLKI
ncbi:uncharacterized protein [Musca autumnalis]|uniref:uncharacterized protein n=1 Tax=Musca autumnalis TaxID=221902 RepID=UPI003CFAF074